MLLRYVAEILALASHINHVLLANNSLARVYDQLSYVHQASAFEVARRYNMQAPMVQAYVLFEMPPWMLRKPNCRLNVASISKKSRHPTVMKFTFRSVSYTHLDVYKRQALR